MKSWLRGTRGEWYVVGQVVIMALVFFGPRSLDWLPAWPVAVVRPAAFIGVVLMVGGATLLVCGIFCLRRSLTPLPYPKDQGRLVDSGPYKLVRHPMYSGGTAMCYGWSLIVHGWLTLLYAIALHIFADFKADREEQWLVEKYPDYPEYRKRTGKLIPFLR